MKKTFAFAAAAALALGAATPALAGWKLVESNQPVAVAKTGMNVRPDTAWNRSPVKPIKTAEVWSLDGAALNELYLVGTLAPGGTLYRDVKKKDAPLPLMKAGMELTDIPEFVESSLRVSLATSAFEMGAIEPATMGGHPAVRFGYEYAVAGSPLKRRALALGTLVGGKLSLVTYTAPSLYFYERDLAKAEAVMNSVTL